MMKRHPGHFTPVTIQGQHHRGAQQAKEEIGHQPGQHGGTVGKLALDGHAGEGQVGAHPVNYATIKPVATVTFIADSHPDGVGWQSKRKKFLLEVVCPFMNMSARTATPALN